MRERHARDEGSKTIDPGGIKVDAQGGNSTPLLQCASACQGACDQSVACEGHAHRRETAFVYSAKFVKQARIDWSVNSKRRPGFERS